MGWELATGTLQGPLVTTRELADLGQAVYGPDEDTSNPDYYEWLYGSGNPWGKAVIGIARRDRQLVAQYAAIPLRAHYFHRICPAALGVNGMTHPTAQGRGLFARLVSRVNAVLRDQGCEFTYVTPGSESEPWFSGRLGYLPWQHLPLWLRALRPGKVLAEWRPQFQWMETFDRLVPEAIRGFRYPNFGNQIQMVPLNGFEEWMDHVWESCVPGLSFAIKRSVSYLQWRYRQCPVRTYQIIGAFQGTLLVGWAVFRSRRLRQAPKLRIASLVDLVAQPGPSGRRAATQMIAAFVAWAIEGSFDLLLAQFADSGLDQAFARNGFLRASSIRHVPTRQFMALALASGDYRKPDPRYVHLAGGDHDMG